MKRQSFKTQMQMSLQVELHKETYNNFLVTWSMKQGLNHNVTSYINSNATSMPVSSYQPDYRVIKCEISASAISSDSQVSTTQTAVGSYVAHGSLRSSIFGNLEFPLYCQ